MANYTTRHLRYLYRLLTSYPQEDSDHNVVLWSEMIILASVVRGRRNRVLVVCCSVNCALDYYRVLPSAYHYVNLRVLLPKIAHIR